MGLPNNNNYTQLTNVQVNSDLIAAGTLEVTGAVTLTTPLTIANIGNAIKRERETYQFNGGNVLADGTTYKGYINTGRAGTLKAVFVAADTKPASGTNTVKVSIGGTGGTNPLAAASFDPTTLTAKTISTVALSATAANVAFTAAQPIYVEWVSGTQSTAAVNASITLEYELLDY